MKPLIITAILGLAACHAQPVEAPYMTPERQEAVARCDYVQGLHGNDEFGGIGARAACMRYFRETGNLPPL